jgi:hypothetical protein
LTVTDRFSIGGNLVINASNLGNFTRGQPLPFITAGNIGDVDTITAGNINDAERRLTDNLELNVLDEALVFNSIELVGNSDVFFLAGYESGTVSLLGFDMGDLNADSVPFEDVDFDLFVRALMNPDRDRFKQNVQTSCPVERVCQWRGLRPEDGGDISGNDRVDFDDIALFQHQLHAAGMSSAGLMAAFDRYFDQVPEPPAGVFAAAYALYSMLTRRGRARAWHTHRTGS